MLTPEKKQQLQALFEALPEAALRRLYQAFIFGRAADPEEMPFDDLIGMIEAGAAVREIQLAESLDPTPVEDLHALGDQLANDASNGGALHGSGSEPAEDEPLLLGADNVVPETAIGEETSEAVLPEEGRDSLEIYQETFDAPADPATTDADADSSASEQASQREPMESTKPVPRNAMHAFFQPFESLIIDPPRFADRLDGYVCSTSLPPIWRLINEADSGAIIRESWAEAERRSEPAPAEFYADLATRMHEAALDRLAEVSAADRQSPGFRRALTARLGGNAVVADLFEFYNILQQYQHFRDGEARIRPYVVDRTLEAPEELAGLFARLAGEMPGTVGYLQFALMNWLDAPETALRLHRPLMASPGDLTAEDLSIIPDHCLSMLRKIAAWNDKRLENPATLPDALSDFVRFGQKLATARREAAGAGDGALVRAVHDVCRQTGDQFLILLKQSLTYLKHATPYTPDPTSGLKRPDPTWLAKSSSDGIIERARAAVAFLRDAEELAEVVGRREAWSRARAHMEDQFDSYVGLLTEDIAATAGERRISRVRLSDRMLDLWGQVADPADIDARREQLAEAARTAEAS